MANYATAQSSSYVVERHSELATGMDLGDGLRNNHLHPEGEVGIPENVRRSIVRPDSSLFMTIKHNGSVYLGRLSFDRQEVCHQIFELLRANYGRSLSEIGSIEVLDAPDSL